MATNSFANFTQSILTTDGQVQIVDPADRFQGSCHHLDEWIAARWTSRTAFDVEEFRRLVKKGSES